MKQIFILLSLLAIQCDFAHGGVIDGQPVNAAVTNAAYISKNTDDVTPSKLGLGNPATASGGSVTNLQAQINALDSYTGTPANSVYNLVPTWTNNNVGSTSDNIKQRVEALTAVFSAGPVLSIPNGGTGQATAGAAFNALSPMTQLGDLIYGSTSGSGTPLHGNTTSVKNFLTQTGTGSVSAAPTWGTISSSDLPTITLTGDVTGSGSAGSVTTALSTTGVTAGAYTSADITVDSAGRITLAANGAGGGGGGASGIELLKNSGFEITPITTGWSWTGGSAAAITSGANLLFDAKTASFTATGIGQTFESTVYPIQGLAGGNCGAQIYYLYAGADGDYTFQVYDGTTVLDSKALPAASQAIEPVSLSFPCGSTPASTLQWQLVSNVASPGVIYFDGTHLGSPALYSATGLIGTPWVLSTHVTPTNLGSITSYQLYERRVGDTLEVDGSVQMGAGSPGTPAELVLTGLAIDATKRGATNGNAVGLYYQSASSTLALYGPGVPQGVLFYDGSTPDTIFFATQTYSSNARIFSQADASGVQPTTASKLTLNFTVPIAGWSAQLNGLNAIGDQASASWSGYHNASCTWFSNSTTYVDPPNAASGGCALVQKKNRNFGAVTTFGGVQPGLVFTPQKTGLFMVVGSTMLSNTNGPTQAAILQMIDQNGDVLGTANSYSNSATPTQVPIHGIFQVNDLSLPTTLKIQIASTSGLNTSYLGNGTTNAIEWAIFQLDGAQGLPYFTGSVTSPSDGQERIARASVSTACTSSPCTVSRQSGNWVSSVVRNSVGNFTVNFTSGTFSGAPSCWVQSKQDNVICAISSPGFGAGDESINDFTFVCRDNNGGTQDDLAFGFGCMGPR